MKISRPRVTSPAAPAIMGAAGCGVWQPATTSVKQTQTNAAALFFKLKPHADYDPGLDIRFLGLDDPARAPGPFYEQLAVPYDRTAAPRDIDATLALRVARAVHRARPDIVHTHLVHADVYGAIGARRLISTKHNDDPFRAGPFRVVERALAHRAARIIAITDALARFQIERVGLPAVVKVG